MNCGTVENTDTEIDIDKKIELSLVQQLTLFLNA